MIYEHLQNKKLTCQLIKITEVLQKINFKRGLELEMKWYFSFRD